MSLSSTRSQYVKLTPEENRDPKFSVLSEKAICREDRKANQAVPFVNNHEENLVSPRDSKSADSL